jgi:glycosyltransferase involved in cell wall biosynthesis
MIILQVHNHYRLRAGEDECFADERELLRSRGHDVRCIEVDNADLTPLGTWTVGLQAAWNLGAFQKVRRVLRQWRVAVVAVRNFFPQLSPSVYYAARAEGAAVVQTLDNFRILCAGATLFRAGRLCTDCLHRAFPWPALLHRCYRNSIGATTVAATTAWFHWRLNTWENQVDMYIAPSHFVRRTFLASGFPEEKVAVKPHFVRHDPGVGTGSSGFLLYAGRLAPEKGIGTLLSAWRQLRRAAVLRIAGGGPLAETVNGAGAGVVPVGFLSTLDVQELMRQAAAVICPSEWNEPFGRTVIEAFAAGTPVIASNIGALPELVEHGRTGLLFRPGDAEDLAAKLEWFLSHPRQARAMRREARAEFEAKYTAERNYPILMEIYERAIRHRQTAGAKPIPAPDDSRHAGGCDQLCRGHAAGAGVGPAR